MKKRTITIALIVFAVALLFGIGYAAWTITRSDSGEATGNFTAYSVEDSGALTVANNDTAVVFGKKTSPATTYSWLGQTEVADEDLVASFDVSWSGGAQSFNLTHTFQYGETVTTVSPLLIGGPTYSLASAVTGASVTPAGVLSFTADYVAYTTVTVVVTYTFGTVFNSENPYQFFNSKAVNGSAFSEGAYNGGSLTLAEVNTALGSSLTATSTFADVASAALAKLDEVVANDGVTGLSFKVAVQKAA